LYAGRVFALYVAPAAIGLFWSVGYLKPDLDLDFGRNRIGRLTPRTCCIETLGLFRRKFATVLLAVRCRVLWRRR
jgi:hypothetical protein